ncbi:MAG: hypothetical protein V2I35_02170 [Desulfocapsaceae bacterium]|jgi:hypothetical protein|nr:hypothetical protein [Desulfocapsaceae bacterium]
MMTLTEKLNEIREGAKQRVPLQMREVMQQATRSLAESGIMARALKVGDTLPPFELPSDNNQMVSSAVLLKEGNVVLCFYRGVW